MNVLDSIIKEIEKSLDCYHPDDLYEIGYNDGLKRAISIIKEHKVSDSSKTEPVAWMREDGEIGSYNPSDYGYGTKVFPLYLHPPRPEPARKPMMEEEIEQYLSTKTWPEPFKDGFDAGIRFAEKHHGIGGDDE